VVPRTVEDEGKIEFHQKCMAIGAFGAMNKKVGREKR
jgi:hypothetical protein